MDGELVEDEKLIKEHIQVYYEKKFRETGEWRPRWEEENLRKLSHDDKECLQRSFSLEEVEAVIKSFRGDKAPGSDGSNLHFFPKCWSTVKDGMWKTVEIFHQKGIFVNSLNSNFIALIPKKGSSGGERF